jgi:DNA (cytosine-5)-methyltransferase 1
LGYNVSDVPSIVSPHSISPTLGGAPQIRDRVYIVGVYVGKQKAWKLADDPFVFDKEKLGNWKPTDWNLDKDLLQADSEIENPKMYKVSKERLEVIEMWNNFLNTVGAPNGKRLPGFPLWEFAMTSRPKIESDMPDWKVDFLKKNSAFYIENKKAIDDWRGRFPKIKELNTSFRKLEWQAQDMKSIWDGVIQFRPSGVRIKKADYLPALVAMNQTSIIGSRRRTITVREAARLQAFPEDFTFGDQNPAKSFKQLGNAVSVGTVKFVISSMLDDLGVEL